MSFVTNIYYLPFQANVWISLSALVIVSCFVIFCAYRVSNMRSRSLVELKLRPSDMVLFGVSSICQMGTQHEPKHFSGKLATVFMPTIESMPISRSPIETTFSDFFRFLFDICLHILHSQYCVAASVDHQEY